MYRFRLIIFGMFWMSVAVAQTADTTVYVVTNEMPRFYYMGCEKLDTTEQAKQQCSQQALLAFIYTNVQYPLQARLDNIEGTVVASFVIEPDSTISNIALLKDIGGGCGNAVVELLNALNPNNIRWIPGKKEGEKVRVKMTLPVKFKLTEAPPYIMVEGDTVYTQLDEEAVFNGDNASITSYIEEKLPYPAAYLDSCAIGYMDVQLLVQPDGVVKTLNVLDYCYLGLDFQLEILGLTTSMFNIWKPATYQGRNVPTSVELRIPFIPSKNTACKAIIAEFEQSQALALEGSQLYQEGKLDESISKMTEALSLFPINAEILAARGQAYLDQKRYGEACQDLFNVRYLLATKAYDSLLPIICNITEEKKE
jgi:hypothetical protein